MRPTFSLLPAYFEKRLICAILTLSSALTPLFGQAHHMPAAEATLLETGVPSYVIRSQDALGLSSPPTDFHLLPDGRVLVYARQEIALGDGTRWDVFHQAPDDETGRPEQLAVDKDGSIYAGVAKGFAKIVFDTNGQWRLSLVEPWAGIPVEHQQSNRLVIQTSHSWLWHNGSGVLIAWRPGESMRMLGRADTVEHAFHFQDAYFISNHTNGQLSRVRRANEMEPVAFADEIWTKETITTAVAQEPNQMLVGTYGRGIQLFDGARLRPLQPAGLLMSSDRINDLCLIGNNWFAAAIEGRGIAFFDRQGRAMQMLDSTIDPRVTHVSKLIDGKDGTLWGLLADGLVRVEFPSPLSTYEPFFHTPVIVAHINRVNGRLLFYADGKIRHGTYDDTGRLVHLDDDSLTGMYATAVSGVMGLPVIGTDRGAYYRTEQGWQLLSPTALRLRIIGEEPINGRWRYAAYKEMGWLRRQGDHIEIEAYPAPGLENLFNAITDAEGNAWIEMGNGKAARLQFTGAQPKLQIFDAQDGIPEGWVQIFVVDGVARLNVSNKILRLDAATNHFVPDEKFRSRLSQFKTIFGRPARDAQGRLWVTADGTVHVLSEQAGELHDTGLKFPSGLNPSFFTFEADGKVWLQASYQLLRYDPSIPAEQPAQPRAVITHVRFPASERTLFLEGKPLPAIEYEDNSFTAHFIAVGTSLDTPTSFEVMLEGAGDHWSPVGLAGSALFRNLKEGNYTLRVRPVFAGGIGAETSLAIAVRPPWYRSLYAYAAYTLSALGVFGSSIWLLSLLQRRDKQRLEHLVAQRTRELNDSNEQLARQVEEIQILSQAVQQSPVGILITNSDETIFFANPKICEMTGFSREELLGMTPQEMQQDIILSEQLAELRSTLDKGESWHGQMADRCKDGRIIQVRATISPLRTPNGQVRFYLILKEDISQWLADQESRRKLETQLFQSQKLESIGTLAGGIAHDFNNILTGILGYSELVLQAAQGDAELEEPLQEIRKAGLRAKDLVAQILTFSRRGMTQLVPLDLSQPVTEALKLIRATTPATIEISTSFEPGNVRADATQIQQVVINLCTNAVHAIGLQSGRIEVSIRQVAVDERLAAELSTLKAGPFMLLTIRDNGHGMDQATLNRIFDPFFTTKQQGQGTGLGLSIVQGILSAHNGAVRVQSTQNVGTSFEMYFPLSTESVQTPKTVQKGVPAGAQQEILVVDDEEAIATYVAKRLQRLGYRVSAFSDPREAIAAFQAQPSRYQAVVTDLTMPYMTGVELIREIRSFGRIVPAIIITGHAREASSSGAEVMPQCKVLNKPFEGDELARLLGGML